MSIISLVTGACVKVSVFPVTLYALVGNCTIPLSMTRVAEVVESRSRVKTVVTPLALVMV